MNYKTKIVGVFLLFCIAAVMTVSAGGYALAPHDFGDGSGLLEISVLCQHSLFSKEMSIQRIDDSNTIPFTSGALIQKDQFDKYQKVGDPVAIELDNFGKFKENYAPGVYGVVLFDGNGGQPEYSIVSVQLGYGSRIAFIGHAVSGVGIQKEVCSISILSATYFVGEDCYEVIDVPAHTEYRYWITNESAHTEYRFRDWVPAEMQEVCYPEVNHTVHHDAVTHEEYVPEVNHTVHHDAVTHEEYVPEVNYTVHYDATPNTGELADYEDGHVHARPREHFEPYDFYYGYQKMVITSNEDDTAFIVTVHTGYKTGELADYEDGHVHAEKDHNGGTPFDSDHFLYDGFTWEIDGHCPAFIVTPGTPAYDEIVVDVPAHYITVTDAEAYDEIVVDVPAHYITVTDAEAYDEIVVDREAYCEQVVVSEAYWGDWSEFSDTPVESSETRQVETRFVLDDMTEGYYSDWSDTPEGSCMPRLMSLVPIENEPCQTRDVEATYKIVCDAEASEDVTQPVRDVVEGGHSVFAFHGDGIYSTDLESLFAPVTDPSPNREKSVTITFNPGCGAEDVVINAQEDEPITIGFVQEV